MLGGQQEASQQLEQGEIDGRTRPSPDKRGNRKLEVLVRHLSGNPTYQELADESDSFFA
jgi:hypothetical protein